MLTEGGKCITIGEQDQIPKSSVNQKFILEVHNALEVMKLQTGNKRERSCEI